jgi:hypothetical protein
VVEARVSFSRVCSFSFFSSLSPAADRWPCNSHVNVSAFSTRRSRCQVARNRAAASRAKRVDSRGLPLFERLQIGDQVCDLIRIEAIDRHRRVTDGRSI